MPALGVRGLDGPHDGIPVAHNDDALLRTGFRRVEQRPVEHLAVHVLNVDQHSVVLTALGFMDRGGVGQFQLP